MTKRTSEQAEPFVDKRTDGPGVSRIDPSDPAAPLYYLLAKMRSPVSLSDMMIIPVRTGYIGQQKALDPADLPKSAARASYSRWGSPKILLTTSSACASKHRPWLSKIRCGCHEWIFPSAAFAFRR